MVRQARLALSASVMLSVLVGCAASDDTPAAADSDLTEDTLDAAIARVLPAGEFGGTHEGRACTVEVDRNGPGVQVTMWHDADVGADFTINGDFFKFDYAPNPSFIVRKFDATADTLHADVAEKEEMQFVAGQQAKIWASALGDPKIASVRIRQREELFGLIGDEMTCANLVPKPPATK